MANSAPPAGSDQAQRRFAIGPDYKNDMRLQRPYFLVTLVDGAAKCCDPKELQSVRERISRWIESPQLRAMDIAKDALFHLAAAIFDENPILVVANAVRHLVEPS